MKGSKERIRRTAVWLSALSLGVVPLAPQFAQQPHLRNTPQANTDPVSLFLVVVGTGHRYAQRSPAEEPKAQAVLQGHTKPVNSMAFSPDCKLLASASYDETVKLWDVTTGKERASIQAHRIAAESVAFSPDGKTLASGGWDSLINLWEVATAKKIATLKGHHGYISAIVFSPDGKLLASAGATDRMVKLWNVTTGKELTTFRHPGAVTSAAFFPSGKTLVSASEDGTIKVWEAATGKSVASFKTDALRMALSPDGKTLALSGHGELKREAVTLLDAKTGQEIATLKGHTQHITTVAFSPSSELLATGSADNTVRLWDVANHREIATLKGHTVNILDVVFSPDGKLLASGSLDHTVRLWDVRFAKGTVK